MENIIQCGPIIVREKEKTGKEGENGKERESERESLKQSDVQAK